MALLQSVDKKTTNGFHLSDREYHLIRDLVYAKFGINLTEEKRSLIVGRLQSIVKKLGLHSFAEYHEYVLRDSSGSALNTLVNRISTNHTFFYREPRHYDFLTQTVLPDLVGNRRTTTPIKLRIWCAGCSSGEEPYTLSIFLNEFVSKTGATWDVRILATDISDHVLKVAQSGKYRDENISKLPDRLRKKYFQSCGENEWRVSAAVRKPILFRRFNLMRKDFPFKGKFDVIFCRNVMIYFDNETKHALAERFYEVTKDDGYLFIGHSETLGRHASSYQYVCPATYRKERESA